MMKITKDMIRKYRKGGWGFIQWCENHLRIPIYPEGSDVPVWWPIGDLPDTLNPYTGRSYRSMWREQKKIYLKALKMDNGRFIYRLIVLCWPRGEGKSLAACLIQLWKFFNWPRQQIMLGANSKEQTKFVHFDIMRDIILNSPDLLNFIGGTKNIQEKEIRLKDNRGNVVSIIRSVSSFSGIFSNITGYTFSEIFDMKNPKFFVQLDGSIRNMPNALGVIDSTVSSKEHILYTLYTNFIEKKDSTTFFSYRSCPDGLSKHYWNPHMTQAQLDSYRTKYPFGEFERYFGNLWSAGARKVFLPYVIESMNYIGADNLLGNQKQVLEILKNMQDLEDVPDTRLVYKKQENRLITIDSVYRLRDEYGGPIMASAQDLERLGDMYETDWAILAGFDRSDPMQMDFGARSIFTLTAKGLIGSRNRMIVQEDDKVPEYIYFLLFLANLKQNDLEEIKSVITACSDEFDGVDTLCAERWGMWDLVPWCEENGIAFEPVSPTYERQKSMFSEFFTLVVDGRFKTPLIYVPGSRADDILKEEMSVFDHDVDKRWFGSPEKKNKNGIQDDSLYSLGWGIYGGRNLGIEAFRSRKSKMFFGNFFQDKSLRAKY
jgi:hypothetical protein